SPDRPHKSATRPSWSTVPLRHRLSSTRSPARRRRAGTGTRYATSIHSFTLQVIIQTPGRRALGEQPRSFLDRQCLDVVHHIPDVLVRHCSAERVHVKV